MTAAVHQADALAALTAARTGSGERGPGQPAGHTSFDDELTQAQRPSGPSTPSVTRQPQDGRHDRQQRQAQQDQQAQQAQQRQGQQSADRDVPRHPVLHGRNTAPVSSGGRATASAARRPVPLHPLASADPATAAVLPTPPALPARVPASAAATAAPADPAGTAPTAPATTALVAGSPSTSVTADQQRPAPVAAAEATPAGQPQPTADAGPLAGQADSAPQSTDAAAHPASPVQVTVTTATAAAAPVAGPAAPAVPSQPAQQPSPDPTATPAPAQASADATAVAQPSGQHHQAVPVAQPGAAPAAGQPVATVTAGAGRDASDQGPSQQDRDQAPAAHSRTASADAAPAGGPATPYSSAADRAQLAGPTAAAPTAPVGARTEQEVPTTQALPAGTLAQVNAAEHSVRVQVETQALGRVTAEMHTRPGEIGVHLSVPDDAGRALMAQRLDALRDSLGQNGSAVHLSLAGRDSSSPGEQHPDGQQSSTPREDGASAPSAPQPQDAVTPRAMDGSSMATAPAAAHRLVDVHA